LSHFLGPLYFVDFRVDWAGFEQIDGDFRSNSFGGSVKRNDSIIPKKYDLARFKGKLTERTFLWSTYTLRFTTSENFFRLARQQQNSF